MVFALLSWPFPKFGRKKLWPQTSPFFDLFVNFLKNYPAKSMVEPQEKANYANLPCISGYALCFEKNMALENVQFLKFGPFFGNLFFFSKTLINIFLFKRFNWFSS